MMCRHFALSSELSGAIAKRLRHAKNQLSAAYSFFNQFVTEIYTLTRQKYLYTILFPIPIVLNWIFQERKSIQSDLRFEILKFRISNS